MMKIYPAILLLLFTYGCNQPTDKKLLLAKEKGAPIRLYSKNVDDTFSISVSLPNGYDTQQRRYPIVYLLDANVYFDIVATTLNTYSVFGLTPEVILVGVGYKDFPALDSLRDRDDSYPTGLPPDSMRISGGAEKFLTFLNNELIPQMDDAYRTDTTQRILMGHSMAGYFTTYALLQDLLGKSNGFSGYIAASPSLAYHKRYMLDQLKELEPQTIPRKINAYFTYGGLEDEEDKIALAGLKTRDILAQLSASLSKHSKRLTYKTDTFSSLGHMDAQMPAFIKGLRWEVNEK